MKSIASNENHLLFMMVSNQKVNTCLKEVEDIYQM